MKCDSIRELLSATFDGQAGPGEMEMVKTHLSSCRSCAAWQQRGLAMHRRINELSAGTPTDRTASIMGAIAESSTRHSGLVGGARLALLFCAFAQLAGAIGESLRSTATGHGSSELLIFQLSIAAAFAVVAWVPERAWGMLPLLAVVAAGIVLTATIDVARGAASFGAETGHVAELIGVALVWFVARGAQVSRPGRLLLR